MELTISCFEVVQQIEHFREVEKSDEIEKMVRFNVSLQASITMPFHFCIKLVLFF